MTRAERVFINILWIVEDRIQQFSWAVLNTISFAFFFLIRTIFIDLTAPPTYFLIVLLSLLLTHLLFNSSFFYPPSQSLPDRGLEPTTDEFFSYFEF